LRKILQLRPEASPPTDSLMSTNSNSTNSVASSDAGAEAPSIWSGVLDPATLQSATGWLAKAAPRVGGWLFGQVSKVASWFGVLATVLTMIPFLGAIATCVTALIIAFVQFGDWPHPLLVLAVFGIVQTLEGLVISPKIMGNRVGLHPLTIIIAVMVGTTLLGGLLGGILAI